MPLFYSTKLRFVASAESTPFLRFDTRSCLPVAVGVRLGLVGVTVAIEWLEGRD